MLDIQSAINGESPNGKAANFKPKMVSDGRNITVTIPISELIQSAKESSTGKSTGVMLDLAHQFTARIEHDGKQYDLPCEVSAGRTGQTWFSIRTIGKAMPVPNATPTK